MGFFSFTYGCLLGMALAFGSLFCDFVAEKRGSQSSGYRLALMGTPVAVAGFVSVPLLVMGLAFGGLFSRLSKQIHSAAQKRFPARVTAG